MKGRRSRDARAGEGRAARLDRLAEIVLSVALLFALAAPSLNVARVADAQSRKTADQDDGAQGEKNKGAGKGKEKEEKGAQEEKSDDARDVKDSDGEGKTKSPALVMPVTPSPVVAAPSARSKPAPPAATKQVPPAATRQTPTTQSEAAPLRQASNGQPTAVPASPDSVTEVNFEQLSKRAARTASSNDGTERTLSIHPPLSINDSPAPAAGGKRPKAVPSFAPPGQSDTTAGPDVPSPSPSQSFLAQEDGPKVNTSTFTIPPDTQGAVGLDKVFVNTNQNYRVEDKTTGAPLSTVSIDTFWSSSGGSGFFDPRITFDPYNQRWILVADSNAQTANSSIEVAVSQTADPQGNYFIYKFTVGCAPLSAGCSTQGEWADFPMLGFNKNWIAVSMNMFEINGTGPGGGQNFVEGRVLVLDYPAARAGTLVPGDASHSKLFVDPNIGFCLHPVETYDPTQNTLYLPQHISSADATYDLWTITGTPSTPVLTPDPTSLIGGRTRPGGAWVQPGGDILPQTCTGTPGVTCPNALRFIDAGDAQIRGNAVFRNNHIYYTQTVGLPAGSMTHTAAQWTKLNTDGSFADGGRVEDPSANSSNGGKWYAYSSIAVNHNDDFLVGFSQFSSSQFASAGYAYHDHADAAGTTREPLVFKTGEDYYAKTFSGSRNRWGDYSHTLVDPFNDTDLWTIQEYAQLRTSPDPNPVSPSSNTSRWGTWWAKLALGAGPGDLVISEFRLRGPAGAQDEYVEIYNASGHDITVQSGDGSAGYGLFASDGTLRFSIPNGTLIPARGHYLGVNSNGYSLASYPAGSATTATGDATYTTDIADNAGLALFDTTDQTHLLASTRFDAVGSNVEGNALFKEGGGYPSVAATNLECAFVRDPCGKGGSTSAGGGCPAGGAPKDTNNNAADFFFVDTTGTDIGAGARLGAPGPENSHSPVRRDDTVALTLLDPASGQSSAPNRVRDFDTSDATRAPDGHITIRRTVTNNTGRSVTRLRLRVVDVSTFSAPAGTADLRALTSGSTPVTVSITGTNPACPSNNCAVQQTTLEQPPAQSTVAGGGFNSSLAVNTVVLGTPIPPGGTINVQLLLGIRQPGSFRILVSVEAETAGP